MKRFILSAALLAISATPVWAQRDLKDIPSPDPELERKTFIVADGFEVNLWAGDPQIAKPIHSNFDEKGRLWIASSEVYPQIKPGQPATDKILVLEDTDGDGKADKTTVFADGLLIPTGVLPGDGGCYVANSTELIHLKDTDGDGKADQRRVVLSGFGTEDTHHLLHTLRWGHDGQFYMNQSIYIHSHLETPWGVRRLNGGGIWRFRPENLALDVFCEGFVNPWGHQQNYWGQSFATDGAYGEGINYVFPGSVFVTAPGAKRRVEGLNPGSPKHCGLEIVGGAHLPDDWQGNMLTNDFRAHRVCRFVVTEDGSGYASRQEVEVIKSTHVAFRPIDVKMGADGAIYIADWYNPIIQHGEVDFRDPRRDHVHGRIWRVSAKGRPLVKPVDYAKSTTPELLDLLKRQEDWIRLWSKLELKRRGTGEVVPAVNAWLAKLDKNEAQYEHNRLEGLWVFQNLNEPNEALLREVLASPDHHARAAAVRVASQWQEKLTNPIAYYGAAVVDAHPQVRLEAVRALAKLPASESAKLAITALDKPMDKFLDFALWQTMRDLEPNWLPAVRSGEESFDGNVTHLTFALKAVDSPAVVQPLLALIQNNKIAANRAGDVLGLIAALGGPGELGAVLDMVVKPDSALPDETKASLLTALVDTTLIRKKQPAGDLNRVQTALASKNNALLAAAVRAAGAWKLEGQRPALAGMIASDQTNATVRDAAVDALSLLGGDASKSALAELAANEKGGRELRARATSALVALDVAAAAKAAVALLVNLPAGEDPEAILKTLLAHNKGSEALAKAMEGQKLTPDTAKLVLRAVRASLTPSPELSSAVQAAGGLTDGGGWKLTDALLTELVNEVKTQGNAARGELVFRRSASQCYKCHAIGGAGGVVGPDLVSIGASAQVDYLVESLLEPNKKVKENYHSQSVVTDDGRIVTGIPVRETAEELVLRDADDKIVTLEKSSIEVRKDGRSLMPDGSVDTLTRAEVVDLARFLSELGKVGPYAIGQSRVARRFETLVPSKEAYTRLARTSFDTVAAIDPTLTWEPYYSLVSGELPVASTNAFELKNWGDEASGPKKVVFVRTELEVTAPGKTKLLLGNEKGLMLWLDGKPTSPQAAMVIDLSPGKHVLVVAANVTARPAALRLELADEPGSSAKVQWVGGK
ncbi:MAG TPA: PVC-type heme-binding CxxCH protein [Pirellulaceae bacterium]|nr:PVC-type heme-binding CxxCH protein [Pirellulaceae bacterium]